MGSQNLSQGLPPSAQKSSARYYILMMLIGIGLTTSVVSLLAPKIILWWYDSPASNPITAACVPAIDWAIHILQWTQLIALAIGAVFGFVLAFWWRGRKSNPLN